MYKSEVKMNYARSITAATPFGLNVGDDLDQPAEFGIGLGYRNGSHGIALDWKRIKWSSTEGYKQFGWDDQDVFALGYQYEMEKWSLRLGYNYASSPVTIADGTTPQGAALNIFNLLGFPATAEDHITAGGSYLFNKNFSADIPVVYALNSKERANISGIFGPGAEIENEHSKLGPTV
jgi:long-chain fatty acid transport protein